MGALARARVLALERRCTFSSSGSANVRIASHRIAIGGSEEEHGRTGRTGAL
jgi:hypothetical protein